MKVRSNLFNLIHFAFFLQVCSGFAQNSFSLNLQGTWVAEGSVFSHTIKEVRDPEFGINYLQYRFQNNQMCVSYNPFETTKCFSDIKFEGDTLIVFGSPMYLIERIGFDEINFTRINSGITQRLKKMNGSKFMYKSDSVYRSELGLHPTHVAIFSSFFFFNSLVIYPAPRADQSIMIEFTVTAQGQVKDVSVISEHSQLRRRWFKNSLINSSGEWIPALINGKPVDCRMKLELIRVGYKTLEAEEKGWRLYSNALKYITKNDYKNALINLNDALVYLPGNARFLFTRAACHFYLKDEKKQCADVLKARETCPFIPTAMADVELGILVECFRKTP